MTRRLFALFAALAAIAAVLAAPVAADPNNNNSEKLRRAVTVEGVQSHLAAFQAIADISGGNRFAGLPGYERSADYVAEQLEAAGYDAQFWYFEYNAFVEDVTTQLRQVSPTPTTYVNGNDFRIMTYSGGGNVTAPLAAPSGDARGCSAADYAGFPPAASRWSAAGRRPASPSRAGFRLKTDVAIAAGASADPRLQQRPRFAERHARRHGSLGDPFNRPDASTWPVAARATRERAGDDVDHGRRPHSAR